jgi:hypothetical protein
MRVINTYKQKNNVHNTSRIYAVTFVREFLEELNKKIKGNYKVVREIDAETIKGMINTPTTKFEALLRFNEEVRDWQKVDYKMSNLGKGDRGVIFYFVCGCCGRLVRHLYQVSKLKTLKCRHCFKLGYYSSKDSHDQNVKKPTITMNEIHKYRKTNPK